MYNNSYNTINIPENIKTKRVNISGEVPDIQLTLLDHSGELHHFPIKQMLLCGGEKEMDKLKREQYVVYYKGKVGVICRFEEHIITKFFKYIPSSKKWFICDTIDDLLQPYKYIF